MKLSDLYFVPAPGLKNDAANDFDNPHSKPGVNERILRADTGQAHLISMKGRASIVDAVLSLPLFADYDP